MRCVSERIRAFEKIRDIPYAVIPGLTDPKRSEEILLLNKGFCYPKHYLLARIFGELGLSVLFEVYQFEWQEFSSLFPRRLRSLASCLPPDFHLTCQVDTGEGFVPVDATFDLPLQRLGFTVNSDWDGYSPTILPATPVSEKLLFHPDEAFGKKSSTILPEYLAFYVRLNEWLETAR